MKKQLDDSSEVIYGKVDKVEINMTVIDKAIESFEIYGRTNKGGNCRKLPESSVYGKQT